MKKTLTALLLSCSAWLTQAQDTYWPLDNHKIFNTLTGAVTTSSQSMATYNYQDHHHVIFDKNADMLFSGEIPFVSPGNHFLEIANIDQVFTIPNQCMKYYALYQTPNTGGKHMLQLHEIDGDIYSSSYGHVNTVTLYDDNDDELWVAAAARLQPGFSRDIYHITLDVNYSGSTGSFRKYSIDKDGNISWSAVWPAPDATGLPVPGGNMHIAKISQDGETIGYADINGDFVTYHVPSNTVTTYGFNFGSNTPIIEQATVGGVKRWYLSDGTNIAFYEEGTTNFKVITPTNSTAISMGLAENTSFALGRDGNMYFANGTGGNPGNLYYFDLQLTDDINPIGELSGPNQNTFTISGAQIYSMWGSNYWFGNEVAGEDVNGGAGPVSSPTMSVGGLTPPAPGSYSQILHCPGAPIPFSLFSPGNNAPVYIAMAQGDWGGGMFVPYDEVPEVYELDEVMNAGLEMNLLDMFSSLYDYSGFFSLTYRMLTPCGQTIEFTQVYELVQIEHMANFFVIGPSYCTNALQRKVTLTSYPTPPTGVCANGWVGATSAGVQRPDPYISAGSFYATEIQNYRITIEEWDGTNWNTVYGTPYSPSSPATFPNIILFSTMTATNYFTTNYSTITTNNTLFRVTVDFDTRTCGWLSKFSYLRIIPGNSGLKDSGDEPGDAQDGITDGSMNLTTNTMTAAYPNPATDKLNIDWYSSAEGNAYVSLTDVLGKEVYKQKLPAIKGSNRVVIDMTPLAAGVYRYTLHTEEGQSTGNIIRQ